jgi:protocatechuate 3,4-dioxygenase beta subunit
MVTGRVLDKATGKPVPGFAMTAILSDNAHVKDYPDFNSSAWMRREDTQPDGSFRVMTIPGPVLLMGGSDPNRIPGGQLESLKYQPPRPDTQRFPQYFSKKDPSIYYTTGGAISIIQGQFSKVLLIKPGTAVVHEDIVLEPASVLSVKIQDGAGRPLHHTWVTGMSPQDWHYPIQVENDVCSAYQVQPGKPRIMAFYHPDRKLVGILTVKAEDKGPAVVKLGATGGVRGRLVDRDGKALTGYVVELYYQARPAQEIFDHMHRARPRVVTDATGSFQIEEVIPGPYFTLYYHRARRDAMQAQKVSEKPFRVPPGEARNLGDLKTPGAPKNLGE